MVEGINRHIYTANKKSWMGAVRGRGSNAREKRRLQTILPCIALAAAMMGVRMKGNKKEKE